MKRVRIFCPSHQSVFESEKSRQIFCEIAHHEIATNFPFEGFWNFCCDCDTFFPARYTAGEQATDSCPICERGTQLRYLCDHCGTISYDSTEPTRSKKFAIPRATSAVAPSCPGCSKETKGEFSPHVCQTVLAAFQSARAKCPFCDQAIESSVIGGLGGNDSSPEIEVSTNKSQGIVCAECQFLNSFESSFCVNCGADISWDMTETVFGGQMGFNVDQQSGVASAHEDQKQRKRLPNQKKGNPKPFIFSVLAILIVIVVGLIAYQFLGGEGVDQQSTAGKGSSLGIESGKSKTFLGTIDGNQMRLVLRNEDSKLFGDVSFQDSSGEIVESLEGTFTDTGFEAKSAKKGSTYNSGFYKGRLDSSGKLVGYWESNFGRRKYFEAYQPTGL